MQEDGRQFCIGPDTYEAQHEPEHDPTILVTLADILDAALVCSPQVFAAGKKGDPSVSAGHPGRPVSPNLLPPPSPSGNWHGSSAAGSGTAPVVRLRWSGSRIAPLLESIATPTRGW